MAMLNNQRVRYFDKTHQFHQRSLPPRLEEKLLEPAQESVSEENARAWFFRGEMGSWASGLRRNQGRSTEFNLWKNGGGEEKTFWKWEVKQEGIFFHPWKSWKFNSLTMEHEDDRPKFGWEAGWPSRKIWKHWCFSPMNIRDQIDISSKQLDFSNKQWVL